MKQRKRKPKMMRLQPKSTAAIERLATSLAFLDLPLFGSEKSRDAYRTRARLMLEHLASIATGR